MPSLLINYCAGSGFVPLIGPISGSMLSGCYLSGVGWFSGAGHTMPVGTLQIRADSANSGRIWISLSGGYFVSGTYILSGAIPIIGLLPLSGGPTITSGLGGQINYNDAPFFLAPGDAMSVPKLAIQAQGAMSGLYTICAGSDLACSGGFGRIFLEML